MATIEIFLNQQWVKAAEIKVRDESAGYRSPSHFAYDVRYASDHFGDPVAAVSCRYPVSYEMEELDTWPPFVLDLLPSGAGRDYWLKQLGLPDGPASDLQLLLHGAGNPPGNLRIREAAINQRVTHESALRGTEDHPGFHRDDILERREQFIEYAEEMGAHVSGSSDVQGVAPKFLLVLDHDGRWHCEGALADHEVASHWIVKFPRGRGEDDRLILANEAAYMRVAGAVGLHANPGVHWENDCLFIPRFDCTASDGVVERLGMESLYSLAGIADFGVSTQHETFCEALHEHCTDQFESLQEYIKRDVLNIALGNKDNHGRNTAVLRSSDGTLGLSPLFDFAPMYLDREGIPRACKWDKAVESHGAPDWGAIVDSLPMLSQDEKLMLRTELADWSEELEALPDIMSECEVDQSIIDNRDRAIRSAAVALREARPAQAVLQPGMRL